MRYVVVAEGQRAVGERERELWLARLAPVALGVVCWRVEASAPRLRAGAAHARSLAPPHSASGARYASCIDLRHFRWLHQRSDRLPAWPRRARSVAPGPPYASSRCGGTASCRFLRLTVLRSILMCDPSCQRTIDMNLGDIMVRVFVASGIS